MRDLQRARLELKVLQHKRSLIEAEMELIVVKSNHGMFDHIGEDIVDVMLMELVCERNRIDVEIAETQFSLWDAQKQMPQAV